MAPTRGEREEDVREKGEEKWTPEEPKTGAERKKLKLKVIRPPPNRGVVNLAAACGAAPRGLGEAGLGKEWGKC